MRILLAIGLIMGLTACASGHCRKPQTPTTGLDAPTTGTLNTTTDARAAAESDPDKRVMIYKYDGSLQCKMGRPVSVKTMQNELKGLTVYSAEKRHDGQMHIQVCGSITGQANVFEIAAKDLKEAEKRGFRVWSFK